MATHNQTSPTSDKFDGWENQGGALASRKSPHSYRFVILDRTNGSKVACQVSSIHFLAEGENGSVLHFGGGSQVNVSQTFEDVIARINPES